ncbi:MAG: DNA methyltransferase [Chloroflexota bacterium]|nr:DNA methyltransferase [Chloroflexota bacterium]MDQ5865127.1 DNA methyltransferase [Chloroflexota bacterium]
MPNDPFPGYLATLERAHQLGNDTEHTHRPIFKILLESIAPGATATNEPKRVKVGAPDYVISRPTNYGPITIGYVEAKDLGAKLEDIERDSNRAQPNTREGAQLKRYRAALPNLLFTDYLDFRWYTDGALRQTAKLASIAPNRTLLREKNGIQDVDRLLDNFLKHQPEPITRPQDLALRMARLTHIIRDIIIEAFEQGQASNLLKGWREAFSRVLIADLDQPEKTVEFADMFAQTLAYGLFSARIMDSTPADFSRQEAQRLIPRTNPFLRDFFAQISGIQMDDEPYAGFVDDLAALLAHTDMNAVLADFGRRTRQEDPVVHFYETFLAAYDPKLRESRGVYYTPEPVVSYLVRSVDHLLRTRFGCREGLADTSMVTVANTDPTLKVKGTNQTRKTTQSHRVLVLDPATGTGTFLYAIVDHIRSQFMARNDAGMWSDYVKQHLLPRLFGFELLMAPYAVAHFKLGLQLAGRDLPEDQREAWAYDFASDERLGVYLTNTLEEAHEHTGLPLFTQWVSDENNAANLVKRELPIMVVIGNPPYSGHSANTGQWIINLLKGRDTQDGSSTRSYFEVDGQPLKEVQLKWLHDDYVKFFRFAQWRVEKSGAGIIAFISNSGYLDNPTFRGMRQALRETFTDIYILDLHGSSKKSETAPDGSTDENVFDIQQGVCLGIFIKEPGKPLPAQVHHAHLWGVRESKNKESGKYPWLLNHDVTNTDWSDLSPQSPSYLFVPQDFNVLGEYQQGWPLREIFLSSSVGIVTARDKLTIRWTDREILQIVQEFVSLPVEEARDKYSLGKDARDWKVEYAQRDLRNVSVDANHVVPVLYRPFDWRFTFYTGQSRGFIGQPQQGTMGHMLKGENLGILWTRPMSPTYEFSVTSTRTIIDQCAVGNKSAGAGISYLGPLYLYPGSRDRTLFDNEETSKAPGGRRPNLNPAFIADVEQCLGMTFSPDGKGDLQTTFGPEDVFHYMYAVFHSPTYRSRYAEFLKIDFPRLPLTSDPGLFRDLAGLGEQLVGLHLMERQAPNIASYPVRGDNIVQAVRYTAPGQAGEKGRVWINKTQHFEGVPPEVWEFHIGGYQVAEKWLKDRKGRQLSYDDLNHYRGVVAALAETILLMAEIDNAIPGFPIE